MPSSIMGNLIPNSLRSPLRNLHIFPSRTAAPVSSILSITTSPFSILFSVPSLTVNTDHPLSLRDVFPRRNRPLESLLLATSTPVLHLASRPSAVHWPNSHHPLRNWYTFLWYPKRYRITNLFNNAFICIYKDRVKQPLWSFPSDFLFPS